MESPTDLMDRNTLEAMIDRKGMLGVLEALALVTEDKAAHLRSNWQDEASAREWERAGKVIDAAMSKLMKMK